MRILVTGSRYSSWGTVWVALNNVLAEHGPFTLVVGTSHRGRDGDGHYYTWFSTDEGAYEVAE